MQVARELFCLQKIVKCARVSNAWVIYLRIGDNPAKAGLIPDNIFYISAFKIKGGLYM